MNVPFGQMLVMIFIVHFRDASRVSFLHKEYFEPFFIMFPLNVIGEVARACRSASVFSATFRRAIIILVVSYLFKYLVLPVGQSFLQDIRRHGQAFVFTMLAMTYIAAAVAGDNGCRYSVREIYRRQTCRSARIAWVRNRRE